MSGAIELVAVRAAPSVISVGTLTVELQLAEMLMLCREPDVLRRLAYPQTLEAFRAQRSAVGRHYLNRANELIELAFQLENS
jgi:hypothetical protein